MSIGSAIPESDARTMVRLLGKIAGMSDPLPVRKRALMQDLARLIDADGWLWSLTRVLQDQARPVSIGLLHGGLSELQIASWLNASQSDCPPPEDAPLSQEFLAGEHFTRTRQQVVPDNVWYAHPAVRRHRLAVGIDHFLYSIYPLRALNVCSCLGFYRFKGRAPFSDRDRRITHILVSEIDWLHHAGIPDDHGITVPQLPPRRREVLIMLLDGHGRKAIARLLKIKPNTAKEHIEAVYAHFAVSSQVELICRFTQGNGRDLPHSP